MRFKLNTSSVRELNDRLENEYEAYYFYRCAANWCAEANYKKASAFFSKEAESELEHAKGIQDYLVDFGVIPELRPISKTTYNFNDLSEIIELSYDMELKLMLDYNRSSKLLFDDDITTFDFLTTYRVEQREAINEYNDLLDALDLIDKTDKFNLLYFEQTYM